MAGPHGEAERLAGAYPDATEGGEVSSPSAPAVPRPLTRSRAFYLEHQQEIDARAAGRYAALAWGQLYGFHDTLEGARAAVEGRPDQLILLDGQEID